MRCPLMTPRDTRKTVSLLVKLTYAGVDEFAEKYATNVSRGGFFIRSREPKPVGTELLFRVELANAQRVMQGRGVVRWVRGEGDPAGLGGMGVEFIELDAPSRALVDRIVANKQSAAPAVTPTLRPPAAAKPPPVAKPPPPPPPAPVSAAALFDDEPFDPPAPPTSAVELDLDVLVAATPAADGDEVDVPIVGGELADETPGFDFEFALDPPPSAAVAPPPPPPVSVAPPVAKAPAAPAAAQRPPSPPPAAGAGPALPEIRRGAAAAPPPSAPRVLTTAPTTPSARGQAGALVFLKPPEALQTTGPVIGIDLGTTNSCVAVLANGKPRVLRSKEGYSTIPSVVGLNSKGLLTVGHRAKQQIVLAPSLTIYGAKRLVGRDYDSPTVKVVKERFRYDVVPGPDGKAAVALGQHTLALEEVQGIILKEMREFAQEQIGQQVHRAVVTCPAYYSEQQREAVRRAGRLAGLTVERVLNEPTAAALAYGLNREFSKRVMVFDLGGGTFDATLLRIDKNVFEVLATGGDVFLGGLDFDNLVVDVLLKKFHAQHQVEFSGDPVALSRVTDQAERAKVSLSEAATYEVHLPMLQMQPDGKPLDLKCTITREELAVVAKPLVDRCLDVVNDVLLDAKLKATQVDDIILVGGMTRMPLVRKGIEGFFKKTPQASVNADEAVALGAALYAGTIDKVSSVTLIDVVPMTIGVGMAGGAFKRIIERNSPLPAMKSFSVGTAKDNDEFIEINVFQGEDGNVTGNDYLGTVRVEGLPKAKKGQVQVAISLNLDAECVLKVEAKDLATRRTFKTTLATRYTSDQIRSSLGVTGPSEMEKRRADELESRAGSFWGRFKRALGFKK
jgi:molecular chaperone DnaK